MALKFDIKKGLDLPIAGVPDQSQIVSAPAVTTVALLGDDYVGMKPTMEVREGDPVKLGQVLFTDKKAPGVQFTSPGSGRVVAVNRGAKRKFESVVIELEGHDEVTWESLSNYNFAQLDRQQVVDRLVESGLWAALRGRPYGKVPSSEEAPDAVFITAIDTNPLAADPVVVLRGQDREFIAGLQVVSTLAANATYLCTAAGAEIPGRDESSITLAEFAGPHPAGLPGTHIHFLSPVSDTRTAWYINYQDVVAVGHLFLTGRLKTDRVISLAGPAVKEPRLLRTRLGAHIPELIAGDMQDVQPKDVRVLSGSVLSGRISAPPRDYLGRYHSQISLLKEGRERELLGWIMPGWEKFSVLRTFASALGGNGKRFDMTTTTGGSNRAIVPVGAYEHVMPLDIIATPLLKALVTYDTEYAQQLGCLELEEEDLALCTFVCTGKYEYGPILRENLTRIELEG